LRKSACIISIENISPPWNSYKYQVKIHFEIFKEFFRNVELKVFKEKESFDLFKFSQLFDFSFSQRYDFVLFEGLNSLIFQVKYRLFKNEEVSVFVFDTRSALEEKKFKVYKKHHYFLTQKKIFVLNKRIELYKKLENYLRNVKFIFVPFSYIKNFLLEKIKIPEDKIFLIPFGFERPKNVLQIRKRANFFFVGSLKRDFNNIAVRWIINYFYPKIKEYLGENFKIFIIGEGKEKFEKYARPNLIFTGYLENFRQFILDNCDIFINPVEVGTFKAKIIEIMSLGVPSISTSEGVKGIVNYKKCFVISDLSLEFVKKAFKLVRDISLRSFLQENCLNNFFRHYSKSVVKDRFYNFFKKLWFERRGYNI